MQVRPETRKPITLRYLLYVRTRNRIVLVILGAQWKCFGQKSDPNIQLKCIAQKLMHYSGLSFPVLEPPELSRANRTINKDWNIRYGLHGSNEASEMAMPLTGMNLEFSSRRHFRRVHPPGMKSTRSAVKALHPVFFS